MLNVLDETLGNSDVTKSKAEANDALYESLYFAVNVASCDSVTKDKLIATGTIIQSLMELLARVFAVLMSLLG